MFKIVIQINGKWVNCLNLSPNVSRELTNVTVAISINEKSKTTRILIEILITLGVKFFRQMKPKKFMVYSIIIN